MPCRLRRLWYVCACVRVCVLLSALLLDTDPLKLTHSLPRSHIGVGGNGGGEGYADAEYLPAVELALDRLEKLQRRFEQTLVHIQAVHTGSSKESLPSAAPPPDVIHTLLTGGVGKGGKDVPPVIPSTHELLAASALEQEAADSLARRQLDFPSMSPSPLTVTPTSTPAAIPTVASVGMCPLDGLGDGVHSATNAAEGNGTDGGRPDPVLFYQAAGGQLCFLLPLCLKALLSAAQARAVHAAAVGKERTDDVCCSVSSAEDSLNPAQAVQTIAAVESTGSSIANDNMAQISKEAALPSILNVKVLEIESVRITASIKARFPFLRHLSENCDGVHLLEVDLRSVLTKAELAPFHLELNKRRVKRRQRKTQAAKEAEDDNARLVAQEVHIEDLKLRHNQLQEEEEERLRDLFEAPAPAFANSRYGVLYHPRTSFFLFYSLLLFLLLLFFFFCFYILSFYTNTTLSLKPVTGLPSL